MSNKEFTSQIDNEDIPLKKPLNLERYSFITVVNDEFLNKVASNIADISAYKTFKITDKAITFLLSYLNPAMKFRRYFMQYWKLIRKVTITTLSIALIVFAVRIFIEPSDFIAWFLCIGYTILIMIFLKTKQINHGEHILYTASFKPNRSDKFLASKSIKIAKKQTPFVAFYSFQRDHLTYHRITHKDEQLVWERTLGGFAVVHDNVTLLYSRPSDLTHKILIMHHNNHEILDILQQLKIEYLIYDFKSQTKNYYFNRPEG